MFYNFQILHVMYILNLKLNGSVYKKYQDVELL